ncbi:quinone oxidoreductase [Seiridium cupressi]
MSSLVPYTTKQGVLAAKPTGAPILSGPDATFRLQTTTVAPERLYVPAVPVGLPMHSGIIAEVIESASPDFKAGDQVMAQKLQALPGDLAITHYLGAFGASGLAAYTGLCYAVKLLGAKRVVGIAGSEEKCTWVRDRLGAHAYVNYKSPTFVEDLKAATPDEVDVYFDNVGGHVLDAALTRMKKNGTIAVCGAVSGYNSDEPMPINNWFEVISMRITIRGFIMLDYLDKAPMILQELIGAAADGRIKLQDGETVVEARIEEQPEIWMRLFSGQNQGKLITKQTV